jgi:hypothetical protein
MKFLRSIALSLEIVGWMMLARWFKHYERHHPPRWEDLEP